MVFSIGRNRVASKERCPSGTNNEMPIGCTIQIVFELRAPLDQGYVNAVLICPQLKFARVLVGGVCIVEEHLIPVEFAAVVDEDPQVRCEPNQEPSKVHVIEDSCVLWLERSDAIQIGYQFRRPILRIQ